MKKSMMKNISIPEDVLFMAFRYALGRRTYVVNYIVEVLTDNWHDISDRIKAKVKEEITEAIEQSLGGDDMDVREWNKILYL